MPYERTGYAPWSLTREAGVQSATVDGTVQVPQYIQPVLSTGFIDEKGNWQGSKSSDEVFIGLTKAEGVTNGASVLFPDTDNFPSISMRGFTDLVFAFKPTNGGNYILKTAMGPDTVPYANLTPVNSGANPAVVKNPANDDTQTILNDTYSAGANVWNIITILNGLCRDQLNLQISIENSSGGSSDIEFGFMRLV
jgi:hypothetical protein